MPRIARGLDDGLIYHVINRGNNRQVIFHKEADYACFVSLLQESLKRYAVEIFSYCLMPNHFHMVVRPSHGKFLSQWMQWLMTSHVRRYHREYGGSGHIWQGRFKSFVIQEDGHLLMVLRYIERNPVRANLARSARDWPWSSHHEASAVQVVQCIIAPCPIERPANWTSYVDEPQNEAEVERIRQCIKRQSPFGQQRWTQNLAKTLGLETTLRSRGRPRKKEGKLIKSSLSPFPHALRS